MRSSIIVGYPGIGKSSVANKHDGFIDLDSSCFYLDDKRSDIWYVTYVKVAVDLALQNNAIFVSSHRCVRDELYRIYSEKKLTVPVVIVYPDINLQWRWGDRLYSRYRLDPSAKNRRALIQAVNDYADNVNELAFERNCFAKIPIKDIPADFDLYQFLYQNLKSFY